MRSGDRAIGTVPGIPEGYWSHNTTTWVLQRYKESQQLGQDHPGPATGLHLPQVNSSRTQRPQLRSCCCPSRKVWCQHSLQDQPQHRLLQGEVRTDRLDVLLLLLLLLLRFMVSLLYIYIYIVRT